MKKIILTQVLLLSTVIILAQNPVGIFADHKDIGNPKTKGDVVFNPEDQSYNLKAGGYNIWFGRDEFHYAFNKIKGDFILTANFKFIGKGVDPHRKYGWMVRANENEEAAQMTAAVHGDGMIALQWRPIRGAYMRDPQDELFTKKTATEIVQLERLGKTFIMRVAHPGEPLQEVGRTDAVDLPDEVLAGIFLCSHNADVQEQAIAWNVRQELTVPDTHSGYRDGILGSKLEMMNVFDGKRKIMYEDKGRFEAPNWMQDGQNLLFNQGGFIYKLPVTGGTPVQVNTGNVKRNNNDHVISMDGKWLGISSHRDGMTGGGSTIYYMPIEGSDHPVMLTDSTPSYLHGWSKDGKKIVYTAQRLSKSAVYNIYEMPISGGAEKQLTFLEKGLADGPEYSPDGKYIYYNATVSGTMQLWRMKPDGTEQTQLTFDEYNNWFAHPSPDNKWIAFLSFPNTIDVTDHPFYKRVMIRMMPVSGGAPKVLAYLYGGQGTINTPSWSPDSKHILFVSNSGPVAK